MKNLDEMVVRKEEEETSRDGVKIALLFIISAILVSVVLVKFWSW